MFLSVPLWDFTVLIFTHQTFSSYPLSSPTIQCTESVNSTWQNPTNQPLASTVQKRKLFKMLGGFRLAITYKVFQKTVNLLTRCSLSNHIFWSLPLLGLLFILLSNTTFHMLLKGRSEHLCTQFQKQQMMSLAYSALSQQSCI